MAFVDVGSGVGEQPPQLLMVGQLFAQTGFAQEPFAQDGFAHSAFTQDGLIQFAFAHVGFLQKALLPEMSPMEFREIEPKPPRSTPSWVDVNGT